MEFSNYVCPIAASTISAAYPVHKWVKAGCYNPVDDPILANRWIPMNENNNQTCNECFYSMVDGFPTFMRGGNIHRMEAHGGHMRVQPCFSHQFQPYHHSTIQSCPHNCFRSTPINYHLLLQQLQSQHNLDCLQHCENQRLNSEFYHQNCDQQNAFYNCQPASQEHQIPQQPQENIPTDMIRQFIRNASINHYLNSEYLVHSSDPSYFFQRRQPTMEMSPELKDILEYRYKLQEINESSNQ